MRERRAAVLAPKVTSADILEALGKRYKDPEYVLLREVRNQTGYEASTTYADAVAFSMWKSRGMEIIGMEIKVSRSDWLREKKKPAKAEDIFRYCDKWYLVTAPDVVASPDELPITWGHLVLQGGRFAVEKEAPPLEPEPPTRRFLASLLRNAHSRSASKAELQAAAHAAAADAKKFWESHGQSLLESKTREYEQLKKNLHDFERASGVRIGPWDSGQQIGEAVRAVLHGGLSAVMSQVECAKQDLERNVRALETFLATHEELRKKRPAEENGTTTA